MAEITITMTDKELHDLANQVQVAMWRSEMDGTPPGVMLTVGQRVIAAADGQQNAAAGPTAYEYVGMYFAMKSRAEHLGVQNALLMKAVEQMAHRGSLMQSALIEAGLVSKIPPPARLLESEWSQSPVVAS